MIPYTINILFAVLLGMGPVTGDVARAAADPSQHRGVPWDTVVAEIQVVMSSRVPDTLKTQLMAQVFRAFHLDWDDYRHFYEEFRTWSPEQVVRFLDRVEKILRAGSRTPGKVLSLPVPPRPSPLPSDSPKPPGIRDDGG